MDGGLEVKSLNTLIGRTITPAILLFGLMTAAPLLFAADIDNFHRIFGNEITFNETVIPALRHWGLMIGGLGILMMIAAFRPAIRSEIIAFCAVEKAFISYLWFASRAEPWANAYLLPALGDFVIFLWCLLYFAHRQSMRKAQRRL